MRSIVRTHENCLQAYSSIHIAILGIKCSCSAEQPAPNHRARSPREVRTRRGVNQIRSHFTRAVCAKFISGCTHGAEKPLWMCWLRSKKWAAKLLSNKFGGSMCHQSGGLWIGVFVLNHTPVWCLINFWNTRAHRGVFYIIILNEGTYSITSLYLNII